MPLDLSTLTPKEAITAIYIGYYDRAPDAEGLEFWLGRYNEFLDGAADGDPGQSLAGIAERFSAAIETRDKYPYFEAPNVADAQDFLTSVYQNLFNRDPDQAGLDHWTTKLVTGQIPVGEIIIRIIQGAQDNGPGFNDRQTVLNKIEVGCDWVVSAANEGITTSTNPMAEVVDGELNIIDEEAYESASTILDGVTDEAQSVTDALAEVDAFIDGYGNDAPDASNDAETVAEDGVLNDFVSATDPDGDALVYSIAPGDGPANGTLVMNADGTYTYTPNADYVGSDSFTYTVTDPSGETDTATVSLTVTNTNDAPVASGVIETTNEETPVTITPSFTDLDNAQGSPDTATISIGSNPSNGSVQVESDGTITYTPNDEFSGTDSFQYIVTDAAGASSIATATVTVNAVNDAPEAASASVTTAEDNAISGVVSATDVDDDQSDLVFTVEASGQPQNGSVNMNPDGTYTYTPNADYNGTDSFTYTVTDPSGGADTATVNLTITAVDDAPVAPDVTGGVDEDSQISGTIQATDVDNDNAAITYALNTLVAGFTLNGDGSWVFNAGDAAYQGLAAGETQVLTTTYTATSGGLTDTGTITVTVTGTNDAPVASDVTVSSLEDEVVSGQLTATDVDGDALTFAQAAGGNLQGGSLSLNADGSYTYTPAADFNGAASFNYTVSDGNGGSATNSVTITIAPVADIFTPDVDNLNGGDGADTFLGNEATLNAGDRAVGGLGEDTVIINVDTGADPNSQNLSFAGFELDVETFRTTVDGDGSATFDMSSSEITGNTFHVFNSRADSIFDRVNLTPDGDGERGNGDDNNDGVGDDEFNVFLDNVTNDADITFTTRPGQVTGTADEVNIVAHNRDANEYIGDVNFFGTPGDTEATNTNSGFEVVDISAEGSPLDVFIEDLNIPGANTLEVVTDTTTNAADLTIGDTSGTAAIAVSTIPGSEGISNFDGQLDNSIRTITGTGGNTNGSGGVALWAGNNGVTGSFGEGADTILGGSAGDNLSGNGGNDVLDGAGGSDVLNGGDGNDSLLGQAGNDTINGDAGNDVMRGGAGNDSQFGGTGNDNIDTGAFGNGAGTEFVDAGADNDSVTTRGEFLTGRFTGQDLDPFDNPNDPTDADGVDQFDGGSGIDNLTITGSNSASQGQQGLNDVQNFQDIFLNSGTFNFTIDNNSVFEGNHDTRVAAGGAEGETTINASGSTQATVNASTLDEAIELIGGDGNDVFIGGRGNDTIEGDGDNGTNNGGNDSLLGGAGNDTFRTSVREMDGGDTIEGDSGTDTIEVNTANGRSGINAGAAGTALILNGNTVGIETLKVVDNSDVTDEGDLVVTLTGFNNNDTTSTIHDTVASGSDNPRIHIDGSDMDANESLIVNAGGNGFDEDIRATGGAGADFFNMGGLLDAGDQLDGGDGFDTVTVSDSQTADFNNVSNIECIVVTGAANGDTIVFGADAEAAFAAGVTPRIKLDNAAGVDVTIDTTAFSGPVIIEDDENDNTFNTGPGDDTIIASTGTDTYNTGDGADVIRVSGTDLDINDSLNTGDGIDTVEMDNSTGPVTAVSNLDTNSTVENYRLTDDGDRFVGSDFDNNTLEFHNGNVNTLTEINVDLTALTDNQDTARVTLNASQQDADFAFNVEGSSTRDTFEKRNDGVDNNIDFDGNGGNDNFILNGGDAGSTTEYSGGDGFDSVTLSGGQITDDGFVNFDTIENLQAEAGQVVNARLGSEADQSGLQQITGSDGNDDVVADSQFNNDMTVITGPGDDTFDFGDTSGSITFVARAGEVDAADDLQGGTGTGDEIRLTADNNTADLSQTEAVETVTVVENGDASIGITITNNTFTGVADNEIDVDASDLDDTVGFEGGLTLNGGSVTGGRVLDVVGGTGADDITTGTGNDTVSSGAGNDTVVTNGGNDTVLLGGGNDTASLGSGNDNATGDAGNDNIDAGIGADTVDGGANNDTITGGQGIDELTGGSGSDRFRYVDVEDSFSLSRDIITDFVEAEDCIVIETQLIANAIADFNAANPGNPVPANIGLGIGAGESTTGFNNAGVFINGQGNVGPGFAVNFSDAQGAISQTARDGVADYILERNAGPNGENKLWIDANDDGVLNGLDVQIFLDVDTLSTQSAVYMIDTIAPTISDVSLSTAEVRTLVNTVSGDFDNNSATPDTQSVYDSIDTSGDTTFEGTFDGIDTDGGSVIYENVDGVTPVAGVITVVGTYGTLTVQANGAYTYQVGAEPGQRSAIEALDDSESASDTFTVNIDDGSGNKASASFTVGVNGADDHPTVVTGGGTVNYVEDAANVPFSGTIVGNDVDTNDALTLDYNVTSGGVISYNSVTDVYTVVGTYGTLVLDQNSGAYTYTPEATAAQQAAVQALAEGQPASDVFTVDIFDGDDAGATTTQITANWTGVNDQPNITVVTTDQGNLVENDPTPLASGTFNVVDIDLNDNPTLAVTGLTVTGTGAPSAPVGIGGGMLSTSLTAAAADAPNGTNFNWNFNAGLEQFDFLALGEVLTLTYTITADDQSGAANATDTQTVTIRIEGTDDDPVIGVVAGTDSNAEVAIEDVVAPITGTLTTTDLDVSDTVTVSVTSTAVGGTYAGPAIAGTAGMLTVDATAPQTQPLDANPDASSLSNVTWTFNSGAEQFDALAEGETLVLDYVVSAADNNGGTAGTETITVTIVGTNDDPVISIQSGDSAAEGLVENAANPLTASDTLTVNDADISDTTTNTVGPVVTGGTYNQAGVGYPGDAAFDGMLVVAPAAGLAADPGDVNNLGWTFNAGGETFEFLAEGETLTLEYPITVTDPFGGTDTQSVTITVTGTNDAPDVSVQAGDSAAASVSEADGGNPAQTATGTLTVTDIDDSDTVTAAVTAASVNGASTYTFVPSSVPADILGMLSVTPGPVPADTGDTNNLTWTFDPATGSTPSSFDFLDDGETLVIDYTVTVTDDSGTANNTDTQTVTITITGANDAPVISIGSGDSATAALVENAANPLTASDTLTVTDVDDSDVVSASVTAGAVGGTYAGPAFAGTAGMMTVAPLAGIAADTGDTSNLTWTFDAGAETFDELAEGETLELNYVVKVADDNGVTDTQTVTVTITGTNDDPVFSLQAGDDADALLVEGDVPQTANGTVTINDIDLSDNVAVAPTAAVVTGNYLPNGAGNGSTPTEAQLLEMMTIAASPVKADPADVNNVAWTFDTDGAAALPAGFAFDYLGNNETQTITYTLTGTDDSPSSGTDTQTITVQINGTNDGNDITIEKASKDSAKASTDEDTAGAGTQLTGSLTVTDIDDNDNLEVSSTLKSQTYSTDGGVTPVAIPVDPAIEAFILAELEAAFSVTGTNTGTNVVDDNGVAGNISWEFDSTQITTDLDWLPAGSQLTLTYTVTSDDVQGGTDTQDVTIVITGVNDAPVYVNGSFEGKGNGADPQEVDFTVQDADFGATLKLVDPLTNGLLTNLGDVNNGTTTTLTISTGAPKNTFLEVQDDQSASTGNFAYVFEGTKGADSVTITVDSGGGVLPAAVYGRGNNDTVTLTGNNTGEDVFLHGGGGNNVFVFAEEQSFGANVQFVDFDGKSDQIQLDIAGVTGNSTTASSTIFITLPTGVASVVVTGTVTGTATAGFTTSTDFGNLQKAFSGSTTPISSFFSTTLFNPNFPTSSGTDSAVVTGKGTAPSTMILNYLTTAGGFNTVGFNNAGQTAALSNAAFFDNTGAGFASLTALKSAIVGGTGETNQVNLAFGVVNDGAGNGVIHAILVNNDGAAAITAGELTSTFTIGTLVNLTNLTADDIAFI